MSIVGLLVGLLVIALLLWAARTILPVLGLPEPVGTIAYVIIIVVAVLWAVSILLPGSLPIGR